MSVDWFLLRPLGLYDVPVVTGDLGELRSYLHNMHQPKAAMLYYDASAYLLSRDLLLAFRDEDDLNASNRLKEAREINVHTKGELHDVIMQMTEDRASRAVRIADIREVLTTFNLRGAAEDKLPAPQGDPTVRRTPHLDAPETLPTQPGDTIEVLVRLDDQVMAEDEYGTDVMIDAPPDVQRIEVQVELVSSPHFTVTGASEQTLVIDRSVAASDPVRFSLQVSEQPPRRPAGILTLIKYRGRPCGHVSRAWDWTDGAGPLPGHAAGAASLPIHVDSMRPDITVTISAPIADGQHYVCSVQTTLLPGYETPRSAEFGLPPSARQFAANQLAGLINARATAKQRRRNLCEAGYRFWRAAPPVFQDLIWDLFDAGVGPASLYIATVEPTLPWELMIPHRNLGVFEERLPLGLEFAIGRWTRSDSASPPQRLPVRNSLVVAPEYSESRRLLSAPDEVRFVEANLNGTRVHPASVDSLDAAFGEQWASLIHFVGHGAAPDGSDPALYLDNDEQLRAESILPLDGFKTLCRRRAPLVFLNACEAGLTVPGLVAASGFPSAFGDIGARAVIAPLWPVDDNVAHTFAEKLYRRALEPEPPPVAEILRQLRAAAYEQDDADTYAAYTFYGDPLATLELVTR